MANVSALLLPALLAACLTAMPAQAQSQQLARTFVSAASGNDANDCSLATPCRTFQRAHDNTLPSGEVTVLDPGGYGAVTITKNISIINDGVGEAGALVSGGNAGVTVTAGANDAVTLRGLTIKGIGFGGGNGIVFNTGKSLAVENCTIRNMDGGPVFGKGIVFLPTTANARLSVSNTIVSDNLRTGIAFTPVVSAANTATSALLTRVETRNNGGDGILVDGEASGINSVEAIIADSAAAFNGGAGIRVFAINGSAHVDVHVVRSQLIRNGVGVASEGGGLGLLFLMGNTFVEGNEISNPNNNLHSYGDNDMFTTLPLVTKR